MPVTQHRRTESIQGVIRKNPKDNMGTKRQGHREDTVPSNSYSQPPVKPTFYLINLASHKSSGAFIKSPNPKWSAVSEYVYIQATLSALCALYR